MRTVNPESTISCRQPETLRGLKAKLEAELRLLTVNPEVVRCALAARGGAEVGTEMVGWLGRCNEVVGMVFFVINNHVMAGFA